MATTTRIHIHSSLAYLNAQHYLQPKADPVEAEVHIRHSIYPAQVYRESHDDKFLAFKKDIFSHPDDEYLHPTRPVQVPWLVVALLLMA